MKSSEQDKKAKSKLQDKPSGRRQSLIQAIMTPHSVIDSESDESHTGSESFGRGSTTDEDLQKSEYEQFDDFDFDFDEKAFDAKFSKKRII